MHTYILYPYKNNFSGGIQGSRDSDISVETNTFKFLLQASYRCQTHTFVELMSVFRDKKEVLTWYFSQTKKSKDSIGKHPPFHLYVILSRLPASTMGFSSPNLTFLHLMSRKAFCPGSTVLGYHMKQNIIHYPLSISCVP